MLTKFKNNHHNLYIGIISIILGFLIILSCSCITSFAYPQVSCIPYYNDGAMFYLMGSAMTKGYTPYIDVFDHKGLYIFYYNAIGGVLGLTGVFFIQVIIISVAIFFIYKAVELYTSRELIIFIGVAFFTIMYTFSAQTPNDSDLELPFNTIMIYFYLRALKSKDMKDFLFGNIFAGISTGISLNLRVSDALLPFAFTVSFLVYCIMHKEYKKLFLNAGVVVLGIIVMSIPPFVHAYFGGFLNDMVEAVYLNNFKYIGTTGVRNDGAPIVAYLACPFTILLFGTLLYFKRKIFDKDFMIFVGVTTLITSIIELIIAFYPHYFIVLYSYLAVIFTVLVAPYLEKEGKSTKATLPTFISFMVLALASFGFNPLQYALTRPTDKINIKFINDNIDEEAKNGHTLIFGGPATYIATNVTIGYGDFSCQSNHVLFSKRYSWDHLVAYLDSKDSSYVITNNGEQQMVLDLFKDLKTYQYEELVAPEGATFHIYKRV